MYRKDAPDDRRIVNRVHLRIMTRALHTATLDKDHTERENPTVQTRDSVDSDDSSDSSSDDEFMVMDDSVVSVSSPARLRRSARVTAGKHRNIHHLPKSSVHN